MIGLMFIGAFLLLLLLAWLAGWSGARLARRHGIAGWKGGVPAFLAVMLTGVLGLDPDGDHVSL